MRGIYILMQLLGIGICAYPFYGSLRLGISISDTLANTFKYAPHEATDFIIIEIIVILTGRNLENKEVKKSKQIKVMIECPYCPEKIQPNAKICKYCHTEIKSNAN